MPTLDEVEMLALDLSTSDRAALATRLLQSLPPILEDEDDGIAEALRRNAEMDADPSIGLTFEELDRQIRQRRD